MSNESLEQNTDGLGTLDLVTFNSNKLVKNTGALFENSEWLTTKEAAIYLRKISTVGEPSANAIHKLVARGTIRRRKFAGRLFFKKKELEYLLESSQK
jgi:hypothetical protein